MTPVTPFGIEQVWVAGGWTTGWFFAAAMVITFFRMLSRGRLRTGREVEELRRDRDERIAELRKDRDDRIQESLAWRTAHDEQTKIAQEALRQNASLLTLGEVSAHVLSSLPRPGKEDDHERT